jgi:hypothetical protein
MLPCWWYQGSARRQEATFGSFFFFPSLVFMGQQLILSDDQGRRPIQIVAGRGPNWVEPALNYEFHTKTQQHHQNRQRKVFTATGGRTGLAHHSLPPPLCSCPSVSPKGRRRYVTGGGAGGGGTRQRARRRAEPRIHVGSDNGAQGQVRVWVAQRKMRGDRAKKNDGSHFVAR